MASLSLRRDTRVIMDHIAAHPYSIIHYPPVRGKFSTIALNALNIATSAPRRTVHIFLPWFRANALMHTVIEKNATADIASRLKVSHLYANIMVYTFAGGEKSWIQWSTMEPSGLRGLSCTDIIVAEGEFLNDRYLSTMRDIILPIAQQESFGKVIVYFDSRSAIPPPMLEAFSVLYQ